jgi:hypothetical protein
MYGYTPHVYGYGYGGIPMQQQRGFPMRYAAASTASTASAPRKVTPGEKPGATRKAATQGTVATATPKKGQAVRTICCNFLPANLLDTFIHIQCPLFRLQSREEWVGATFQQSFFRSREPNH